MDYLIDTFFVSLGAVGAFFASKVIVFAPKATDPPRIRAYDFQPNTYHTCPKCTMAWSCASGYTYCECEEYHSGHFHMECKGTRDGTKNAGCKFKYIMRTK